MLEHHDFLNPRCLPNTIDCFAARKAIVQGLQKVLPLLQGTLLDVGAGKMPYRPLLTGPESKVTRYLGMDLPDNRYAPPEISWNGSTIPLEAESIDCAIATEVLEHCPQPEQVLAEVFRVLKPRGVFFMSVPFLWPLHVTPYDEYRYTPFALQRILQHTGFTEISIQATGGWDASLAQLLGLWARRRVRPRMLQGLVSWLLWPFVALLHAIDTCPQEFKESTMIPGLYVIIRK